MITDDFVTNEEPQTPQQQPPPPPPVTPAFQGQQFISQVQNVVPTAAKLFLPDAKDQFSKIKSGLAATNSSIVPYFAVDYRSILFKIRSYLIPFNHPTWNRLNEDGTVAIPIDNPNAPELYTPLFFSFLFLLLNSVISAINKDFTYQGFTVFYFKYYTFLGMEVLAAKIFFFAIGKSSDFGFLTLLSDFGQLPFYLCCVTFFSWNSVIRIVACLYFGLAGFIRIIRVLQSNPGIRNQTSKAPFAQTYGLFGFAVVQIILVFLFAPKVKSATVAEVVQQMPIPTPFQEQPSPLQS